MQQADGRKMEEACAPAAASAKEVAAGAKGASSSSALSPLTATQVLAAACTTNAQAMAREFELVAELARGALPCAAARSTSGPSPILQATTVLQASSIQSTQASSSSQEFFTSLPLASTSKTTRGTPKTSPCRPPHGQAAARPRCQAVDGRQHEAATVNRREARVGESAATAA